jgi:hypothetical protein
MFYRILLKICFLLILQCSCYAKDDVHESSIAKVHGEKIYLKPGVIQIANNGIFINVDGRLIAIDHLEMDDQGVYFDAIKMSSLWLASSIWNVLKSRMS